MVPKIHLCPRWGSQAALNFRQIEFPIFLLLLLLLFSLVAPFANNKVCTYSLGVLCSKSNQWVAECFRAPDEQVSLTLYGVGEVKGSIPLRDKKNTEMLREVSNQLTSEVEVALRSSDSLGQKSACIAASLRVLLTYRYSDP